MAKVGEALKNLPKDKRLAQTCNIEAIGQLGNAGRGYAPDAVVASAFAKPVIDGTTYRVVNGAFRAGRFRLRQSHGQQRENYVAQDSAAARG